MAKMTINLGFSVDDINIYLPDPRRLNPEKQYPVLWLLHDMGGNCEDWGRYSMLEAFLKDKDVIVVCPAGNTGWYSDTSYCWRMQWYTNITEHLWNFVMRNFPASDLPGDNTIAGSGMGGYGALLMALRNPDKFSCAISMDGDLDAPDRYAAGDRSMSICGEIFENSEQAAREKYSLFTLLENDGTKPEITLFCAPDNQVYASNSAFAEAAAAANVDVTLNTRNSSSYEDHNDILREILMRYSLH